MAFTFRVMDEASARAITGWRYAPPYDLYNTNPAEAEDVVQAFLDPQYAYYAIRGEDQDVLAYCCFGADALVRGGDYSAAALDIGMGVRPDLTGQGRGDTFVSAVIDFARQAFMPPALRVTIAEFNQRAQRVWKKAGFQAVQTFQREPGGHSFVVMTRDMCRVKIPDLMTSRLLLRGFSPTDVGPF